MFLPKVQISYDLCPLLGSCRARTVPSEFLGKVGMKRNEPDAYQLVSNDLPRAAGKKPSAKRKRKANEKQRPLVESPSSCTATLLNCLGIC